MLDRITLYDIPADCVSVFANQRTYVLSGLYFSTPVSTNALGVFPVVMLHHCDKRQHGRHVVCRAMAEDVYPFAVTFVKEKPVEQPLDPPAEPKVPTSIEVATSALRDLRLVATPLHEEGRLRRDQAVSWRLSLSVIEELLVEAECEDVNP